MSAFFNNTTQKAMDGNALLPPPMMKLPTPEQKTKLAELNESVERAEKHIRDEALKKIIVLKLAKIQRRLQETHRIAITYEDRLIDEVAKRCTEVESGARNVDNILTNTLLPEISKQILGRIAEGEKPQSIHVGIGEDGSFLYS